jgi:hypothetical protein
MAMTTGWQAGAAGQSAAGRHYGQYPEKLIGKTMKQKF